MLPAKRSFFRVERKPKSVAIEDAGKSQDECCEVLQQETVVKRKSERVPWPTAEYVRIERRDPFKVTQIQRSEIHPLPLRLSEMLSLVDYLPGLHSQALEPSSLKNNWDEIYAEIKGRLEKEDDDPIDEDRWLPVSLQELAEHSHRHIYLLHGAVGVGKSHMALALSNELQLPLIEVGNASGDGRRRPKQLEDLLKGSQHQQSTLNGLWNGRAKRSELTETIILIDEIDLVWPADRGFYPALSAYLKESPPSHIVILTSNADPHTLKLHVDFPSDCRIRRVTGADRRRKSGSTVAADWPIEWSSLFDFRTLSSTACDELESVPVACFPYDDFVHAPTHPSVASLISALHTHTLRHFSRDTWILDILSHWSRMERHVLDNAAPGRSCRKEQRHGTHVKGLPIDLIRRIRDL